MRKIIVALWAAWAAMARYDDIVRELHGRAMTIIEADITREAARLGATDAQRDRVMNAARTIAAVIFYGRARP